MTDDDRAVLALAGAHYQVESQRSGAAATELGLGAIQFTQRLNRFAQRLNRLTDDPASNPVEPQLRVRLRRVRAARLIRASVTVTYRLEPTGRTVT